MLTPNLTPGTTGTQLPPAKCFIFTLLRELETSQRRLNTISKSAEKSTFSSCENSFLHLASLQFLLSICQCKRIILVTVVRLIIIIFSTQSVQHFPLTLLPSHQLVYLPMLHTNKATIITVKPHLHHVTVSEEVIS